MIDRYFYFVFNEEHKLLETAVSVEHPRVTRTHQGKVLMVVFNLNLVTPLQIKQQIVETEWPSMTDKMREGMLTITKLFF